MKKTALCAAILGAFCIPAHAQEVSVAAPPSAYVDLAPTQGNTANGLVQFTQEEGGVRVTADINGLPPGVHGFHIHEKGDCSAPGATSAGGHFNPEGQPHGKFDAETRHIGDLPSLEADANGNARLNALLKNLPLSGENSIVGRGMIIHADPDDYVSQPTGNAGARVACGIITGIAQ